MENTKKIIFKAGQYSLHPKDAKETTVMVPEDALFFTGGENETGNSKHVGAVHMVMITKASDEMIKETDTQAFNATTVNYRVGNYKYELFRINGYGFVEFSDLIPIEGIEFTDADEINRLLDLANHPVYTILFNDECALCDVSRIDRINSYYNVECKSIQLYSQIGSRYYPMIHTNVHTDLNNAINPFHKFNLYIPDEEYGKEIFDEVLYTVLSDIYPEMKSKLIGYDLDYVRRVAKYWCEKNKILNVFWKTKKDEEEVKMQIAEDLEKFYKEYPDEPDSTDFELYCTLQKKLPLKQTII